MPRRLTPDERTSFQSLVHSRQELFRAVAHLAIAACCASCAFAASAPLPKNLRERFEPPAEFAGQFGNYASPLKFYDGRSVATPAEWPARRAEILKYWHDQMGPWP